MKNRIGYLMWLFFLIYMQSPFVICKLFKKQELSLEDEAAEPAVSSSPTSSPDETKSEVSVVVKTEDVKRYDVAESSLVVSSGEATTAKVRTLQSFNFRSLSVVFC